MVKDINTAANDTDKIVRYAKLIQRMAFSAYMDAAAESDEERRESQELNRRMAEWFGIE